MKGSKQNTNGYGYLKISYKLLKHVQHNVLFQRLSPNNQCFRLMCKMCLSPQERQKADSIEWEWAPQEAKQFQPIDLTEHVVISPVDKTLHLYNLQTEQTGQYICRLGESLTAPYFVTVVNISDAELNEVHTPKAPLGPYPTEADAIEEYRLILDTEWSPWSVCSTCDKIGRKHKLGYCTIFSNANKEVISAASNSTVNETEFTSEVTPVDLELFTVFKYGIPCRSHILSPAVKNLPQVIARKNEIMIGYCKVECPKEGVFELIDKDGKVIEKANNSAGIYSLMQELPPLEPDVARILIYAAKGKPVVLSCPGNLNTDAPILWQIGDKNLIPDLIVAESKGRIYVSISDKIYIKIAKLADSNVYSCWQQKELAGVIRLVIEKKFEMHFNHHIMLMGLLIILSVFLYVFTKAFFGRKYAKV
ncbi:unnamed protein product [Acanthoscelides obtectus]|uniref:Ig-like domain-containing protein n=1 Tax=Acanthoscelides obtectus TaxID=200917 RepID=A0A9P0LUQ6_ACAOB|nr:unnamed protein product [Acanthoscelides obtectus]CAK1663238.1 hypothetical protein AOBTE_LOCUS23565 [Acanthoscelides obtectus]